MDGVCTHSLSPFYTDWGLYFFRTNGIRDKCQLGHAMVAGMDFTLGRFVPQEHAAKYMRTSCKLQGWRAYWKPGMKPGSSSSSSSSGLDAGGGGNGHSSVCNASLIPGYLTMCPGAPAHPVRKVCGVTANGANRTERGGGGGAGNGLLKRAHAAAAGGNASSARGMLRRALKGSGAAGSSSLDTSASGVGGGSKPPKSAREALKELVGLRDDALISGAEFEAAKKRVLDAVVTKAVSGLGPAVLTV